MHVSDYNLVFDVNQPGRGGEKILYNPLARSLDVVSVELTRLLGALKERPNSALAPRLGYLFERGYLYKTEAEQEARVRQEFQKADQSHRQHPVTFIVAPTFACNLRCTYCFQQYMDVQYKPKLMTKEVVEKATEFIVRQVMESGMSIIPVLYLFGGEPLMSGRQYREITELIIDRCKQFHIPVAVVTNGVHLKDYADKLAEVQVFEVKVTFNGSKAVHDKVRVHAGGQGTYDEVMAGVQAAVDRQLPVTINCVGDRQMYDSLPELIGEFDKRGWLGLGRSMFQFQSEHECSDLFKDTFESIAGQKAEHRGQDAQSPLRDDYAQVRLDTLKRLVQVGNTNDVTQSFVLPDCRGVRYIFDNGKAPSPSFFCSTTHLTWSLDVDGNLYVCIGSTGDKGAKVGEFYPEVKLDREALAKWQDKKNVFEIPKCKDCKVRFVCGSGCARLKIPSDPVDPTCEPIEDILQVGFDYYFPRIEEKWLKGPRRGLDGAPLATA